MSEINTNYCECVLLKVPIGAQVLQHALLQDLLHSHLHTLQKQRYEDHTKIGIYDFTFYTEHTKNGMNFIPKSGMTIIPKTV